MLAKVRWFFRERVALTPWEFVLIAALTVGVTAYFIGFASGRQSLLCYKQAAEYEAFWPDNRRTPG